MAERKKDQAATGLAEADRMVHFDNVRQDLRDELKMRITQRDNFAIQYAISLGAILLATTQSVYFILALPLIAMYFTTQILYSYHIHDMLCYFLREKVEKEIIALMQESELMEWENFTCHNRKVSNIKVPGIRKNFFIQLLWVLTIGTTGYFLFNIVSTGSATWVNILVAVLSGCIYLVVDINLTVKFVVKSKGRKFE